LACIGSFGGSPGLAAAWGDSVVGRRDVLFAPPAPLALSVAAPRDLAVLPCM